MIRAGNHRAIIANGAVLDRQPILPVLIHG
jgi:hypothetical protein